MVGNTTKKLKIQAQEFPFSIKQLDEDLGTFEGYASTWSVDLQKDQILRGAFANTIAEAKAKMERRNGQFLFALLFMHDPKEPIGGIYSAEETQHGLFIRGLIDLETPQGRRAFSGMKKGYCNSFSIGYRVVKDRMGAPNLRILEEISLIEVSVVSFPANPEAQVTDVKMASVAWMESIIRDMERMASRLGAKRRSNGMTTDFDEAAFGGHTDRSPYGEPVSVPDGFEDPAAFEVSLRKQRRDDDPVLGLLEPGSKAYQNEVALRTQMRDKKRAEQKAALEAERAEAAERQRLMSAPTFTPKSFAQATGLDEPWLRGRFQGWVASGLVTAIDEKSLTLDANDVRRMARVEHGRFETRFIEMASRRAAQEKRSA